MVEIYRLLLPSIVSSRRSSYRRNPPDEPARLKPVRSNLSLLAWQISPWLAYLPPARKWRPYPILHRPKSDAPTLIQTDPDALPWLNPHFQFLQTTAARGFRLRRDVSGVSPRR